MLLATPLLFHPHTKGSQILMDLSHKVVKRQASFCNAITFSNRPVLIYEQVRLKVGFPPCSLSPHHPGPLNFIPRPPWHCLLLGHRCTLHLLFPLCCRLSSSLSLLFLSPLPSSFLNLPCMQRRKGGGWPSGRGDH